MGNGTRGARALGTMTGGSPSGRAGEPVAVVMVVMVVVMVVVAAVVVIGRNG